MGKKYKKGKFAKECNKKRYEAVSASMKERFKGQEHSYCSSVDIEKYPDLSHVLAEEVLDEEGSPILSQGNDDWREGRRIVELGVLADALAACKFCGNPLQLRHTKHINTFGIAANLKVQCMNTGCFKLNNVPTGKRHGHNVWDANTKLATAMIHAGIGERQVNSILGALNVPTVSHRMLDMRQREVGLAMEAVAEQSIEESLQEEVDASYVKTGERKVVGSVDAGWQKRGSGNAYNSLSGHCSMIGKETGKIIGFEVRSKSCRVCDSAQASKSVAEPHDCRKNWEGSSKAMEQDMVMSIVVKNREKGVGTSAIIGDDDTSTISLLHAQVDSSIEKISDRNHVKKVI